MSDTSSNEPGHDAGRGWAPPGHSEPTQPIRRPDPAAGDQTAPLPPTGVGTGAGDPPPPPPPPPPASATGDDWSATGGWAPPPMPGASATYGAGGWQAPPPPARRTGLVVGVIVGVLALAAAMGVGAVLLFRATSTTGPVAAPEPREEAVPGQPRDDAERPAPEDVPADVESQAEAVLQTINASEERMIAFQEVVVGGIGDDGAVGDNAALIAREAQQTGDDLTALRSDLRALGAGDGEEFEGLRDIRDTYVEHMDAWIEYVDAVAGSPPLAAPQSPDARPLWRDIETTGDDFVAAVRTGLPDGIGQDLQDLARFIVERGFGGFDDGGGVV